MNKWSLPNLHILLFLGRDHPNAYHTREISRRLGLGLGTTSRSLKSLEEHDLVIKEDRGNMKLYQANMNNPLLPHLKIFFSLMELDLLLKDIRGVVDLIVLFGSSARGEDHLDSDLDLLVVTKKKGEAFAMVHNHQAKLKRNLAALVLSPDELATIKRGDEEFYNDMMGGKILYESPSPNGLS